MSLVAALLIGSSAFAIENTTVSGDANVFYGTSDANDADLFDAGSSAADIGLNLNATTDLIKTDAISISAGAGLTVLTTLGLENNLVNAVWGGAHTVTAGNGSSVGLKVDNAWWMNEAWVAATAGNTTAKLGRMALDTPLAFTETWTIEKNTFEGAVLINTDIPATTLIGAFIGNGNGTETFGVATGQGGAGAAAVVNADGQFDTYGSNGAYAVAAINNSFKPLTLQAWYYDVTRVAEAYWLQADLACEKVPGLLAGAQYTALDINKNAVVAGAELGAAENITSDAYAVMLGFEKEGMFTAKASYSAIGADHSAGQNTATDFVGGTAQSKLYTEAWWNYGKITQADTQSFNVTVEAPVANIADVGVYYTNADQSETAGNNDLSELTITASKSMGPVDATLAYVYANIEDNDDTTDDASNTLQVYLTVNF